MLGLVVAVGGGRVAAGAHLDDRAGDQVVGGVQPGQNPAGLGLVLGTPDDVIAKLAPFVEVLGALPPEAGGHLASRLTYPGVPDAANAESIRLYATEVVPALRELAPGRVTGRRG